MRKPSKHQSFEILKERGIPIETILDVGVQHHTPELYIAFPNAKHILFEPVSEYEVSIRNNYKNLDFELHSVAVSDQAGSVALELRSIIAGTAITHAGIVDARSASTSTQAVLRQVEAVTLDGFLAGRSYNTPYLLKVDIDGHELAVIAGATNTLRKTSVVVIETPKSQLSERISAVKSQGFELFDLSEPVYYDQSFWQCDAIFIRRDLYSKSFRQLGTNFDSSLYTPFK